MTSSLRLGCFFFHVYICSRMRLAAWSHLFAPRCRFFSATEAVGCFRKKINWDVSNAWLAIGATWGAIVMGGVHCCLGAAFWAHSINIGAHFHSFFASKIFFLSEPPLWRRGSGLTPSFLEKSTFWLISAKNSIFRQFLGSNAHIFMKNLLIFKQHLVCNQ